MRTAALLCALVLCQLIGSPSAFALTSADIARSWGLLGEWQVRCGGTPNDENPIYLFRTNGPQVVLDRNLGDDRRDTQTLVNVRLAPNGARLRSRFPF